MGALGTAHTQEAVGQDAAFQVCLELVLDELRQVRACLRLDLGEEGLELFLHHPVERGVLRPVPLVGEACARRGGPRGRRMKGASRAQAGCAGHGANGAAVITDRSTSRARRVRQAPAPFRGLRSATGTRQHHDLAVRSRTTLRERTPLAAPAPGRARTCRRRWASAPARRRRRSRGRSPRAESRESGRSRKRTSGGAAGRAAAWRKGSNATQRRRRGP